MGTRLSCNHVFDRRDYQRSLACEKSLSKTLAALQKVQGQSQRKARPEWYDVTIPHPKVASQRGHMKNVLTALICGSPLVAALLACPTQDEDMPQQTPVTAPANVATQDVGTILERMENLAGQNAALRSELRA